LSSQPDGRRYPPSFLINRYLENFHWEWNSWSVNLTTSSSSEIKICLNIHFNPSTHPHGVVLK
jgi:hypothetical protein